MKNRILKESIIRLLKDMLPFNELEFEPHFDHDGRQLTSIDLYMRHEHIRIKKGTKAENISDINNKIRICLKDIYNEFEEEIQKLFLLKL